MKKNIRWLYCIFFMIASDWRRQNRKKGDGADEIQGESFRTAEMVRGG